MINIVLRRDYDGVDVKLTYGSTFDGGGDQRQIDLGAGFSLEQGRTSVLLAASYSETDELLVEDRDLYLRGTGHILPTIRTYSCGRRHWVQLPTSRPPALARSGRT